MEEKEVLIQAVEQFGSQDSWNNDLERFIAFVARTGNTLAPWEKVQKVFMSKLSQVLDEFYTANPYKAGKINANATNDDFDEMKSRLLKLSEDFDSPPFTIQRLCELLSDPRKNYTKCDKFMRGLEKNLMVVSSWTNTPRRSTDANDTMMNGMSVGSSNGFMTNDRLKPHWANLPPSPIATAPPKIPGAPDFTDISQPKEQTEDEKVKQREDEPGEKESEEVQPGDEGKTSNVSATIVSSSPSMTINIKRKIDDSSNESPTDTDNQVQDPLVAESPTKKLKSDAPEEKVKLPEGQISASSELTELTEGKVKGDEVTMTTTKTEESSSSGNDSALTQNEASKGENMTESPEKVSGQEVQQTVAHMDTTNPSSDDGTSVDPPKAGSEESHMDVD